MPLQYFSPRTTILSFVLLSVVLFIFLMNLVSCNQAIELANLFDGENNFLSNNLKVLAIQNSKLNNGNINNEYDQQTLDSQPAECRYSRLYERVYDSLTSKLSYLKFTQLYNRIYSSPKEFKKRFSIYKRRISSILKIRAEFIAGRSTYSADVNKFADWTSEELRRLYGFDGSVEALAKLNKTLPSTYPKNSTRQSYNFEQFNADSDFVDLRSTGCVLAPGDQGSCGSCYAFAALGAIETLSCLATNRRFIAKQQPSNGLESIETTIKPSNQFLVRLAPQQLVDCLSKEAAITAPYPSSAYGCNGAPLRYAIEYLRIKPLVATNSCYPYRARQEYCRLSELVETEGLSSRCFVRASSVSSIVLNGERQIIEHLKRYGPVVGSVLAKNTFHHYSGGVYKSNSSEKSDQNYHAVLIIGYGTTLLNNTTPPTKASYWLVKNSWGPDWGESGFARVARGINELEIEKFSIGLF